MTRDEYLKFKAERRFDDFKKIMETEHGRRYVWGILESAGIFRTTFTGNSTSFFNEGRRALGLEIYRDVQALPELRTLMEKENLIDIKIDKENNDGE